MKPLALIPLSILFSLTVLPNACKKSEPILLQSNIDLRNQSLSVLKSYTRGRFQLQSIITAGNRNPQLMSFMTITQDSITWISNGNIQLSSKYKWIAVTTLNGYKTYLLDFTDGNNYPMGVFPEIVKDDTLVLAEDGADARAFLLTRIQ